MTFDEQIKEMAKLVHNGRDGDYYYSLEDNEFAFIAGANAAREILQGEHESLWKDHFYDMEKIAKKNLEKLRVAVEALEEYRLQGKLFSYDGEKEIDDYGSLAYITLAKIKGGSDEGGE